MKRPILLISLIAAVLYSLVAMAGSGGAQAADSRVAPSFVRAATPAMLRAEGSPFRPSKRAQAVRDGLACWSACQSDCTWGEAACLAVDAQGRCLHYTDRCDRVCQSDCRRWGGPLLGFVD